MLPVHVRRKNAEGKVFTEDETADGRSKVLLISAYEYRPCAT